MHRQPLGSGDTKPGVGHSVSPIVHTPQLPPSSVDDHGIAALELEILPIERLLEVLDRNLVGIAQHADTF